MKSDVGRYVVAKSLRREDYEVSVRAILEGSLIGLGIAFLLALILAMVDYQFALPGRATTLFIWIGAVLTALGAGWVSGRLAEHASWFHGALAAVTLNLVSTVIGETLQVGNATHLWSGLGVAMLSGMVGGVIGSLSQNG